jgi:cytidylate kinase
MTIITISRGSYSKGKEIAEKVAKRLGYECLGRDVLLETSEHYHIPEIKLVRAVHDAPSILERFGHTKEKYVAFLQVALLNHLKKGNVVYHGLAGHFFLKGISHVLKVRIIADMKDRVQLEMERENISEKDAEQVLKKDDEERRKWSQYLYGIDTWDPSLYDLVIHIRKITTDVAVETICNMALLENFQATADSKKAMEDLALAAEVKAALIDIRPFAEVTSQDGVVFVKTRGHISQEPMIVKQVKDNILTLPGVKDVHVEVSPRDHFFSM